jgi:hypothetical protein
MFKEAAGSDGEMLPLNHVELVLLHTTPSGLEYRYRNIATFNLMS